MGNETIEVDTEDIKQLIQDVQLLKSVLLSEGELTDWAKEKLAEARKESEENYTSLENLRKEIEDGLQS